MRSWKYSELILALDDKEVYTAHSIAEFALEVGFIQSPSMEQQKLEKLRIRLSMTQMRQRKEDIFPLAGDELRSSRGQAPLPAWYGWRWKKAMWGKT